MPIDLVEIRMRLTGGKQVAGEAKVANSEIAKTGAVAEAAGAKSAAASGQISKSMRLQASTMKTVGRNMSTYVTLPSLLLGGVAIKTAANFDRSMAQVGVATERTGPGMESLRDLAIDMGAKTIFSANESAEAMLDLSKAGIRPAQIEAGALATTMNLAATEGLDLARSGEIVGAAMNIFNLKANESVRIADALAGGSLASTASVEGLALSLAQGGQGAAEMGLPLEETVGTLAAFAQNGMQASDAGTSLKTFLGRLAPTSKKAREEMNRLNLDFFNSRGEMKSMAEIGDELQDKLGRLTDEERSQALAVIFGSDARRAANIVRKEGAEGIERYTAASEKEGAAAKMASAQMEGLPGAIERLQGSLETAALAFGTAIAPAFMEVATVVESLANGFTALPEPVQTTIAAVAGLAALAGPVLWFAGSLATARLRILELRTASGGAGGGIIGKGGMGRLGAGALGIGAMTAGGALGGKGGEMLSAIGGGAGLGFAAGGPMGAAIGATAGAVSLAIPVVAKLLSGTKQLTFTQYQLARNSKVLAEGLRDQRQAGAGLVRSTENVNSAQRRQNRQARRVKDAESELRALRTGGAGAGRIIGAERNLAVQRGRNRKQLLALKEAEKLQGLEAQRYKQIARTNVLNLRNEVNVRQRQKDALDRQWISAKKAGASGEKLNELAVRGARADGNLRTAKAKLAETISDAARKVGPEYARFLERATRETLEFGSVMDMLKAKTQGLLDMTDRLREGGAPPGTPEPSQPGTRGRRPGNQNTAGSGGGPSNRLLAAWGAPANGGGILGRTNGRKNVTQVTVPVELDGQVLTTVVATRTEDEEARI